MKYFAIGLFTLLVSVQLDAKNLDHRHQSVLEFQKARFEAIVEENGRQLADYLDEDLSYTHTTGDSETKAGFIETITTKYLDYLTIQPREVKVRTEGNVAIITGNALVRVQVAEDTIELNVRFLEVSQMKEGKWQLLAWQTVKLAN